ncbi:MAG: hypothetical protein L3J03_07775 [Desulfobacterales bacterium]|nr:hypothetical protein [Desulfobacterales bacterium]
MYSSPGDALHLRHPVTADMAVADPSTVTIVDTQDPSQVDTAPPYIAPTPYDCELAAKSEALVAANDSKNYWDGIVSDLEQQLAADPTNDAIKQRLLDAQIAASNAHTQATQAETALDETPPLEAENLSYNPDALGGAYTTDAIDTYDFGLRIESFMSVSQQPARRT